MLFVWTLAQLVFFIFKIFFMNQVCLHQILFFFLSVSYLFPIPLRLSTVTGCPTLICLQTSHIISICTFMAWTLIMPSQHIRLKPKVPFKQRIWPNLPCALLQVFKRINWYTSIFFVVKELKISPALSVSFQILHFLHWILWLNLQNIKL